MRTLILFLLTLTTLANAADVTVTVDKSVVLEQSTPTKRISVSNAEVAEAVAVSAKEILVNGKVPGETTLMLWDTKGVRKEFNIHVVASTAQIDAVRGELAAELGPNVSITVGEKSVFLRGLVPDEIAANRAASICATLGKVINLLSVAVPEADPQILLKVRFASISRSASQELGLNIFGLDQKGLGNVSTGQFGAPPTFDTTSSPAKVTFTDLLNIFYVRPDLNLAVAIKALEAKSLLEILAEPNLLTTSGKPASFLAGGEFPFPTIQGGAAGVGQITVQFKEFGIRLNFVPAVTPRGTIKLAVSPEVSSLDYANGLVVNGFTIPGLATRRVQTEVELSNGQSFVIAGLLNNQTQEQLNKIPGLGNIPLLGKLFQSRLISKNNTELMVMVTPQIVRPLPAGAVAPDIKMPLPYMKEGAKAAPQQPGENVTGPIRPIVKVDSLPIELITSGPQMNLPPAPAPAPALAVVPIVQPQAAAPATATPPPQH